MRLCDQDHVSEAKWIVPELDLAFCSHHWETVPAYIKALGHPTFASVGAVEVKVVTE